MTPLFQSAFNYGRSILSATLVAGSLSFAIWGLQQVGPVIPVYSEASLNEKQLKMKKEFLYDISHVNHERSEKRQFVKTVTSDDGSVIYLVPQWTSDCGVYTPRDAASCKGLTGTWHNDMPEELRDLPEELSIEQKQEIAEQQLLANPLPVGPRNLTVNEWNWSTEWSFGGIFGWFCVVGMLWGALSLIVIQDSKQSDAAQLKTITIFPLGFAFGTVSLLACTWYTFGFGGGFLLSSILGLAVSGTSWLSWHSYECWYKGGLWWRLQNLMVLIEEDPESDLGREARPIAQALLSELHK